MNKSGSMKVCGRSFIRVGEAVRCAAWLAGAMPQLFIRPYSSPARLSQNTFSRIAVTGSSDVARNARPRLVR